MSSRSVRDVLHGSDERVWIATVDGLNMYDGRTVRVFRSGAESHALRDSYTRVLVEDDQGYLWVGTNNGGLGRFDPVTNGFDIHDPSTGSLSATNVTALLPRRDGRIWVGSTDGLLLYDPDSRTSKPYAPEVVDGVDPNGAYVSALAAIGERDLLVGTFGSGLLVLDAETDRWSRFNSTAGQPFVSTDERVVSLETDPTGRLWVATWSGLFEVDRSGVHHHRHVPSNPKSLPSDLVISVLVDSHSNLWVGTSKGLAVRWKNSEEFFVARADDIPGSLAHDTVVSLTQDSTGLIWVGTAGGGVVSVQQGMLGTQIATDQEGELIDVRALLRKRDGRLLVGSTIGLYSIDASSPSEPNLQQILSDRIVTGIFESTDSTIWVGSHSGVEMITTDSRVGFLSNEHVVTIDEPTPGEIWFGTGNGLFTFSTASDSVSFAGPIPDGGVNTYVFDMQATPNGALLATNRGVLVVDSLLMFHEFAPLKDGPLDGVWINRVQAISGSRLAVSSFANGLAVLDTKSGDLRFIGVSDGLPTANVRGVVPLDDELWILTTGGVCQLDLERDSCVGVDNNHELGSLESTAIGLPDGRIAVGLETGLRFLGMNELRSNRRPPRTVISEVSVMGLPVDVPLANSQSMRFDLPYDRNAISVSFSALDFVEPSLNRYRYRVGGDQVDWIELGHQSSISLVEMAPGEHVLEVIGSNNNGVWSDSPAFLHVEIGRPFWSQWWFRLALILATFSVFFAFYRTRMRNIKRLHEMRQRIADDLHDDIGSRMSSISVMANYLSKRQGVESQLKDELDRMSESASEVVDALIDTIWVVDAERDTVRDLAVRLKAAVTAQRDGPRHVFESSGNLPEKTLEIEQKRDLLLMYKEVVNNTLKHADATTITTRMSYAEQKLTIEVCDDGVGFDPADVVKGRGLGQTMLARAERLGADLSVKSKRGTGTTVAISIRLS